MTLLGSVILIIGHNVTFNRRLPEKRLAAFIAKHWACHRWPSRCHLPHSSQRSWLRSKEDFVEVAPKTDLADAGYRKRPQCRPGRVGDLGTALDIASSDIPVAAGATSRIRTGLAG